MNISSSSSIFSLSLSLWAICTKSKQIFCFRFNFDSNFNRFWYSMEEKKYKLWLLSSFTRRHHLYNEQAKGNTTFLFFLLLFLSLKFLISFYFFFLSPSRAPFSLLLRSSNSNKDLSRLVKKKTEEKQSKSY